MICIDIHILFYHCFLILSTPIYTFNNTNKKAKAHPGDVLLLLQNFIVVFYLF